MRASRIGAKGLLCLALFGSNACGETPVSGDAAGTDGGPQRSEADSAVPDASIAYRSSEWDGSDGGNVLVFADASDPLLMEAAVSPLPCPGSCRNTWPAPDCPGCDFPGANAPACLPSAPAITIVYPSDNVLLPPNLNVLSVQWTPHGAPYVRFSVDFSSPPHADLHVITRCAAETIDAHSGVPSAGCELVVDPVLWSLLSAANRGGSPVTVTVRGTVDGTCVATSTSQIHMSFASEDLLGTYYYWKSDISLSGIVGGQIWRKTFGDLAVAEQDVTASVIPGATCNGCHALSRDGSRMVVYADDGDWDDEYGDIGGSLFDMSSGPSPVVEPGALSRAEPVVSLPGSARSIPPLRPM